MAHHCSPRGSDVQLMSLLTRIVATWLKWHWLARLNVEIDFNQFQRNDFEIHCLLSFRNIRPVIFLQRQFIRPNQFVATRLTSRLFSFSLASFCSRKCCLLRVQKGFGVYLAHFGQMKGGERTAWLGGPSFTVWPCAVGAYMSEEGDGAPVLCKWCHIMTR